MGVAELTKRVAAKQAALANARQTLADCTLTAPAAGIITARSAEPGQIVGAAQTVLTLPGRFRLIEPVADASTRAHRLRIALADGGQSLRLGTLVTARLDQPEAPLLTLPLVALRPDTDPPQVWSLGLDRRAEAVQVRLGQRLGDRVVIPSGR